MKFGHRVQGTIQGYDEKGRGLLKTDGSKIVIPFTADGDVVDATFVKRDRGFKLARLETVTTAGADRVTTPCPHAGTCGGCLWQHLAYDAQLTLKRDFINRAFEQAGHDERVVTVEPAKEQFYYRNRMDYAIGWNGEIGLKEYDSWNRYVDVTTCMLLNEDAGKILDVVRQWMKQFDLQPWDAKFYTGDIRYVVIREGKHTQQRVITVVIKDFARLTAEMKTSLVESFMNAETKLKPTSILIGEQALQTDLSLAQNFEPLLGEAYFEELANDVRFRIHPNSFFQTNTKMAEELQKKVAAHISSSVAETTDEAPGRTPHAPTKILDLYCGLGFFGIYLAKTLGLHVHGHEIDAEAIKLATFNATQNGVENLCSFTSGPAEDLSWKDLEADLIILDPPRAGLHPKVVKTLLEKKPKTIVYVSCNYKRLVEELKEFKTLYRVEEISAFDLFPQTAHVEVVAKLVRIA